MKRKSSFPSESGSKINDQTHNSKLIITEATKHKNEKIKLDYRFNVKKGSRFSMYGSFDFIFQVSENSMNQYLESFNKGNIFICSNLPVEHNVTYRVCNSYKSYFQDASYIDLIYDCILTIHLLNPEWKYPIISPNGTIHEVLNRDVQFFIKKSRIFPSEIIRIPSQVKQALHSTMKCIIVGDLMSHKSTIARYTANHMIKNNKGVIIVQCSPENSCFNAPGILSIVIATKCLFDGYYFPDFELNALNNSSFKSFQMKLNKYDILNHSNKAISDEAQSLGIIKRVDIAFGYKIEDDINEYLECIEILKTILDQWIKEYKFPCIIDTSSYTISIHQNAVYSLIKIFKPSDLLICYKDEERKDIFINEIEELKLVNQIESLAIHTIPIKIENSSLQSKLLLDHSLSSSLMNYFKINLHSFSNNKLFKCPWNTIGIRIHESYDNKNILNWISIMHLLNGSIVTLISSSNNKIITKLNENVNNNSNLPIFLLGRNMREETVIGIGIISHIDMHNHLFYFNAPNISFESIQQVNLIQFSTISLPNELSFQNNIPSTLINYDLKTEDSPFFRSIYK